MPDHKLTPFEQIIVRAEDIILTWLVPIESPGPVFKWLFKVPIFFYKIGLPLFGGFILLLTTKGRKSGKPHHTPLEYRLDPQTGDYLVMAGWGGKIDWVRNVTANPLVQVQAGLCKFTARAERMPDAEVADHVAEALRLNPRSERIWSRWAGKPVHSDDKESLLRAAKFFPSFRLKTIPD